MTDSASVLKELRKLPENKVCMDCTDKMPSFVCLELGTFVCTSCAGIHRELGHHIKSVTLSIFTPEEVELVSAGGNQNAKKIWLGKWTPSVFPQPGPADKANIREFIKLKYIDKLWYAMPNNPLAAPESKPATVNTETSQAASSTTLAVDPVEQYKSPFETPKVNPVESSVSWRANFDQFDAAVNKLNKSLDILEIQEQSAKTPSKPAENQYQHQQGGDLITFDLLTGAVPPKPQEQPQQTQYIVRESSPPRMNQSQDDAQQVQSQQQTSQYVVKQEQPPQYIQQSQQSPQPSPPLNQRVASPPSPSTTYQQMTQQSPPMMHGQPMPQMVSNYPYGTQFMGPQMVPPMMPPMGAMPMPVYLNQYGQPIPMPQMGGPQPMMMPMPMGATGMPMPMPMPIGPNGMPMMMSPGNPKATQGGMPQPIIVNQYGQPVTLPPGVQPIPIMLPPGAQPPERWLSRPHPGQQQVGKPVASAQPTQHLSDYELAKKLQEEENRQAGGASSNNKKPVVSQPSQPSKPAFKPMSDEEYARRLQEEENTKGGGSSNSGYKTTPSVTNPGRGAYFKSDEELARQLAQEEDEDD